MAELVLLTGATGLLGLEVLPRLRRRFPRARLVALVRDPRAAVLGEGVERVRADVADPDLREGPAARLLEQADYVVHMAADIRWNQEHAAAIETNARGTQRLVEILQAGSRRLKRFVHVSTAFVEVPERCDRCAPFVTERGRAFNNSYEHSKWLAEEIVRSGGLPWAIVRPSLVVSARQSEVRYRYGGLDLFMQFMARGIMPVAIGDEEAFLDVVPDALVADAVVDCLDDGADERVAMVCGGRHRQHLPGFLSLANAVLNEARRSWGKREVAPPTLIACDRYHRLYLPFVGPMLTGGKRRQLELLMVQHPYLVIRSEFTPPPGALVYDCPPMEKALERAFRAWCEANPGLVRSELYDWRNGLKPEFRAEASARR